MTMMNIPDDPSGVNKVGTFISGMANRQSPNYKAGRALGNMIKGRDNANPGAGTYSPEHFEKLAQAALSLDAQQHSQAMERFHAANEASKPGKRIGFSAAGDVNISERPERSTKEKTAKQPTAPAVGETAAVERATTRSKALKSARKSRGKGTY